jgi:peptidyl-prolyl cis-trans isomerase B (cyclophilin B)
MKTLIFTIISLLTVLTFKSCAQNNAIKDLTQVQIITDSGIIKLALYNESKLHKENFLKLINEGFYDGQLFHRVIKDFMIQGGDPNSINANKNELLGQGGPGYTIPAEIDSIHFHKKGALAAARKGDNLNPLRASSGSQFYIVQGNIFTFEQLCMMVDLKMHSPFTANEIESYTKTGGSPHLDGAYTVFGEVTEGFDVLDKIANMPVDAYDRPISDIKFTIKIVE